MNKIKYKYYIIYIKNKLKLSIENISPVLKYFCYSCLLNYSNISTVPCFYYKYGL
jgi:hypothetical protein